jgi:arylsulfatase A-like enzyme
MTSAMESADTGQEPPAPGDTTGQADGSSPAVDQEWARRGRAYIVHTILFAAFLLALRIDKVLVYEFEPSPLTWVQVLSPEVSLLLLSQAAWLLTIRFNPAQTRWWATAYVLFHLPIYALMVVGHRFYHETSIVPKWQVFRYALAEASMLRDLIATGVDKMLVLLSCIAVALLASVPLSLRYLKRAHWGNSLLIPGVMTVVGAGAMLVPGPNNVRLLSLASNWVVDLLPEAAVDQYMERPVTPYQMYVAPTLEPAPAPDAQRPNVLLLVLESTGTAPFTSYTQGPSRSPFIDELASQSLVVDHAYTTVSHTTKALVGLICGMKAIPTMKADEAGPWGLPLNCLPKLLHQAGYRSGFFQPAGNFEHRIEMLKNMGFQVALVPGQTAAKPQARKAGYLGWDERVMIAPAVDWMASSKQPFFAAMLTLSTHHPYESQGSGPSPSPAERQGYYDRALAHVDQEMRLLFAQLESRGLLQNTIVFIVGDHGEAFGEHAGFFMHDRVPYEEVIRTPLMIYAPGIVRPGRITGLRQHTDLVPTILEMARLPWKGVLPGSSLFNPAGHDRLVTSCWYPAECMTLRQGDLAFVFHFGRIPLEVFDLAKDPKQQRDIAAQFDEPTKEAAIDAMLNELASIQVYYGNAF